MLVMTIASAVVRDMPSTVSRVLVLSIGSSKMLNTDAALRALAWSLQVLLEGKQHSPDNPF